MKAAGGSRKTTATDGTDLGAAVWSAICSLDTPSRQVFLLVRFQQHSVELAAKTLQIPTAEARRLLAQATQHVESHTGLGRQKPVAHDRKR